MGANRGGAGEGNLGNTLAGGQGLAGLDAVAVNNVQHARRQQVTNDFHQYQDAGRRLLGRLQHGAVTRSQTGAQFPGRHQNREVPWNDLANDTQRLMEMVRHGIVVDLAHVAFLGTKTTREVAEVISREGNVGVQGFAHGLAVVPGFSDCELLEVGLDAVRNFQQDVGTLGGRGPAPRRCRLVRCVQGQINIFGTGARNFTDHIASDRCDVLEILAFYRGNPLPTDVVLVTGFERNDGAILSWLCVDHDLDLLLCLSQGNAAFRVYPFNVDAKPGKLNGAMEAKNSSLGSRWLEGHATIGAAPKSLSENKCTGKALLDAQKQCARPGKKQTCQTPQIPPQ